MIIVRTTIYSGQTARDPRPPSAGPRIWLQRIYGARRFQYWNNASHVCDVQNVINNYTSLAPRPSGGLERTWFRCRQSVSYFGLQAPRESHPLHGYPICANCKLYAHSQEWMSMRSHEEREPRTFQNGIADSRDIVDSM